MQHYFGKIVGDEAFLEEEDLRHLKVRRAEIGEPIEISTEDRKLYQCEITSLSPLRITVKEEVKNKREPDIKLTLAFSLLKSDHNELIIQKATEIGATSFAPFVSERSIVRPEGKEDNKLQRMRKIAKEAAVQCRRNLVPAVLPYSSFEEILRLEVSHRYLAYEGLLGDSKSLFKELNDIKKGDDILVLIGPEGGFSDKEILKAKEAGFEFVSLGRSMLRAETAAIYATSLIVAKGEE